jgi:ABC-type bacteriocin/lantibiotic exporter with double-glycine peptidase domain
MNVKSHVELIQKFIDELPNTDVSKQTKKIPNPEKGLDIVFKDIEYTHNSAKEKLFDKLNLRIRPFEKVAILGTVGSGKSSVVSLISALQKFQGGNIFINETPITEIDIINLRENIIYIPQRPKLFNRTLRENLTYGLPSNVSVENIFKFMNDNGFTELEKIFRKRLDDKVGKNGSKFSGGQLAMIWFLRAAMQKAQLIITDEASAALDPQSRKQIKKMIDIIAKDKSIIVITHDDEMTIGMDRIITFEKGKIISDIKGNKNSNNNNNNGNRWN